MSLKINTEILNYINNDDVDKELRDFLISCLILEQKRYKTSYPRYFEDYDEIISMYVK
ncbi:MAG: hypothetical protein KO202_04800 [Methanobacteriaceae archaeon]|jgi:hypothetical protein|nr:hypothetical protein [Methanobacteriaceae archaeon]